MSDAGTVAGRFVQETRDARHRAGRAGRAALRRTPRLRDAMLVPAESANAKPARTRGPDRVNLTTNLEAEFAEHVRNIAKRRGETVSALIVSTLAEHLPKV